jgi:hypothetical protein
MIDCGFPSKALLRERDRVVKEMDERYINWQFVVKCARFILSVDRLRREHEELANCQCWYEALRARDEAQKELRA